ncbi:MAG: 3-hydroxyacyl-CoA dehydrogenase NAD-binding domain-containing protein, partial [Alphaproteobacteria bacterium]
TATRGRERVHRRRRSGCHDGRTRLRRTDMAECKTLGVVGAGQMGAGIAQVAAAAGLDVILVDVTDEAVERGRQYLGAKWDSIDDHYKFSDGHLATVKGYESYGKMAKTYSKMKDAESRKKMTEFYVNIQIVGTPDDCIQQIGELQRLTGTDHIVCDFSYGGMPHHEGELNMRMFASEVMPTLQHDHAFKGPAALPELEGSQADDIFAPA